MASRKGRNNPTGLTAYFKAIKDIFELQTKVLTGALPHYGERGRNDEQRVSKLLKTVLPHRFSLGTGFIISSQADLKPSSQIDIIIHDELYNSPLYRELAADVFPIEAVYGTVEVKAELNLGKMREAFRAIASVRKMAKRGKFYADTIVKSSPSEAETTLPKGIEVQRTSYLAPRAYIVGYDATAKTPNAFIKRLAKLSLEFPTVVLHGAYAIQQDWLFCQEYESKNFRVFEEDGLLNFTSKLLSNLQSFPMKPMSFSRYLENEALRAITESEKDESDEQQGDYGQQ